MSAARKANDAPHSCPVCGRTYRPGSESLALDDRLPSGTLVELQVGKDVCIKATDWFFRIYTHEGDQQ